MLQRDSTSYAIMSAVVLCVVCSLVVSVAAVSLKPMQEANQKLDRQKNILDATGLSTGEYGKPASELSTEQIKKLYGWISEELVNLDTGSFNTELKVEDYNPKEAAQKEATSVRIEDPAVDPGVDRREKVAKVYFVTKPGEARPSQVVLPVYGKGLWSTMYGYLAVKNDLETIQGLTFYEHGETPGLGGEVDNPRWKEQWSGVKLYKDDGEPAAYVYKGTAPTDDPYAVDGLSGATITSRGVTNLIQYWVSEDGYGPFLAKLEQEWSSDATPTPKSEGE